MGLPFRGLSMLLVIILLSWVSCFSRIEAQGVGREPASARALDSMLQDFAYRAFDRPRTGVVYDGVAPSNLLGIQISAVRLKSGSLFTRGVPAYKQFRIPFGVVGTPYVERLVLVYQDLGNWSAEYYPLPGYVYLAPVLGLLAYDGSNLSAVGLRELDVRASEEPITIEFTELKPVPDGRQAICVWFDLNGGKDFSNVTSGNKCVTYEQGHFSIVVESVAPSPAPVAQPPSPKPRHDGGGGKSYRGWIILGSVGGGVALLVLLALLVLWVWRLNKRKKMHRMEKAADAGEALHMTTVGNTRAPAATTTRTQPSLETEYVP